MCLSVRKTFETCCGSISGLLEARQDVIIEKTPIVHQSEIVETVEVEEKIFISDRLASMTQATRKFFNECKHAAGSLQKSMLYKILTRTTQPAHLASMIIVLFISYNIFPDPKSEESQLTRSKSPMITFMYLASFATHFGAQIWMTFVSGLALYFSLPRHTFGLCQEVLFPKYFLLNTLLSVVTVVTFTKINANFNDFRWITQLTLLSVCLVIEMVISFYLTPSLLLLMRAKYQYERELGNGSEVGYQKTLPTFNCEEYKKVHKNFRKVHMMCAMGNVAAICCTFAHLYYLASKISIV